MSQAGILSGASIEAAVRLGSIHISDFDRKYLNPASYDLRLGSKVAVYKAAVMFNRVGELFLYDDVFGGHLNLDGKDIDTSLPDICHWMCPREDCILSAKEENEVYTFDMKPTGWLLKPGIGYLMHTVERVRTNAFVPIVDGKSSLGRLFVTAHITAGYGDPGFDGQYTLEVVVTHPVVVYPGMRFCQMRFHTMHAPECPNGAGLVIDYKTKGHYVGSTAEGPVPSMSWKQFDE